MSPQARPSEVIAVRGNRGEQRARKALTKHLPSDKFDLTSVEEIVQLGYPAVQPILYDLFKWIRDEDWPVAKPVSDFLVTIGPELAPEIRRALQSHDPGLKLVILRDIVKDWPTDGIRELSHELFQIATDGCSWGADLQALRLLARHRITDRQWISEWLEFKRDRQREWLADIEDILRNLNGELG